MSLSIGGYYTYNNIAMVKPMNYALSNRSEVSDVYQTEATKETRGINAASPVGYANAQAYEVDSLAQLQETQQTAKEFNAIASGFSGTATGYGSDSMASSYELIGSTIDIYA